MDGYQFISSIVSATAWPIAILLVAYSVKRQLPALIARLREFTFPGGGAKFDQDVNAIEKIVAETKTELPQISFQSRNSQNINNVNAEKQHSQERINFTELAGMYPKAAVFQAFKEIEEAYIDVMGYGDKSYLDMKMVIRDLAANGYLTKDDENVFDALRRTRDLVTHDNYENLNLSDILNYKSLCDVFSSNLRSVLISKFRPDLS